MDILVEYKYYNPERNEISHFINKTLKEYAKKYGDGDYPWYIEYIYNTQFFDKNKNRTKNISTKHNPKPTVTASNGRYQFVQINNSKISVRGEIKKDVISIYMKCYNKPLLWRKFFLNIANNREYIFNYCNRPLHKFDR